MRTMRTMRPQIDHTPTQHTQSHANELQSLRRKSFFGESDSRYKRFRYDNQLLYEGTFETMGLAQAATGATEGHARFGFTTRSKRKADVMPGTTVEEVVEALAAAAGIEERLIKVISYDGPSQQPGARGTRIAPLKIEVEIPTTEIPSRKEGCSKLPCGRLAVTPNRTTKHRPQPTKTEPHPTQRGEQARTQDKERGVGVAEHSQNHTVTETEHPTPNLTLNTRTTVVRPQEFGVTAQGGANEEERRQFAGTKVPKIRIGGADHDLIILLPRRGHPRTANTSRGGGETRVATHRHETHATQHTTQGQRPSQRRGERIRTHLERRGIRNARARPEGRSQVSELRRDEHAGREQVRGPGSARRSDGSGRSRARRPRTVSTPSKETRGMPRPQGKARSHKGGRAGSNRKDPVYNRKCKIKTCAHAAPRQKPHNGHEGRGQEESEYGKSDKRRYKTIEKRYKNTIRRMVNVTRLVLQSKEMTQSQSKWSQKQGQKGGVREKENPKRHKGIGNKQKRNGNRRQAKTKQGGEGVQRQWTRKWNLTHREYAGEHSLEGDGPTPLRRKERVRINGRKYMAARAAREESESDSGTESDEEYEKMPKQVMDETKEQIDNKMYKQDFTETVTEHLTKYKLKKGTEGRAEDEEDADWTGDTFIGRKPRGIGLRVESRNASQKLLEEGMMDRYINEMEENEVDILTIQEPARALAADNCARLRNIGKGRDCSVKTVTKGARPGEGTVIIIRGAWQKVWESTVSIRGPKFSEARATRTVFRAAGRRAEGTPQEIVAIYTMYGYANKQMTEAQESMQEAVKRDMEAFREKNMLASVLLGGDLNGTLSTYWDTDRGDREEKESQEEGSDEEEGQGEEKDAARIKFITRELRMTDSFRECHPTKKRVTRVPPEHKTQMGCLTEEEATKERKRESKEADLSGGKTVTARTLDYWFVTSEIASHPLMRAGIHKHPSTPGDHKPVYMDVPIDCTHLVEGVQAIWNPHKGPKQLEFKEDPTDEDKENFNKRMKEMMARRQEGEIEPRGEGLMEALKEAAKGTIAKEVQMNYPKRASTTQYREGWGHKLDAWTSRLRGISRMIGSRQPHEKKKKALDKAKWSHRDIPIGIEIDMMENLREQWRTEGAGKVRERIRKQIEVIRKQEKKEADKTRRGRIAKATKAREERFRDKTGKGKGRVIASIFRIVRERHDLKWVRDSMGNLASSPQDVQKVVGAFFEDWMKSRISVEERWGTYSNMKELNTEHMGEQRFKDFVEECYGTQKRKNLSKAKMEGWFDEITTEITMEQLKKAIKEAPNDSAAGPSQIGNRGSRCSTTKCWKRSEGYSTNA